MRSKWKGRFISKKLFYSYFFNKKKKNYFADRRSTINYKFEQSYFLINNGESNYKFKAVKKILGFKFGDFSLTRKLARHLSKKKRKK